MPRALHRRWNLFLSLLVASALAVGGAAAPAHAATTFKVEGKATVGGVAVTDAIVVLYERAADGWRGMEVASVSASGDYSFSDLKPGVDYTLIFRPSHRRPTLPPEQGLGGTLAAHEPGDGAPSFRGTSGVKRVDMPLAPGVLVSGKIIRPAGGSAVTVSAGYEVGNTVAGIVTFYYRAIAVTTTPDASGNYAFRLLPGHRAIVKAYGDEGVVEPLALTGTTRETSPITSAVTFTKDTTLPTKTLGSPRGASGRVVTATGGPLQGAAVTLYRGDMESRSKVAETSTGSDGRYAFPSAVFAGHQYYVEVRHESTTSHLGGSSGLYPVMVRAGTGALSFPDVTHLVDGPWASAGEVLAQGVPAVGSTMTMSDKHNGVGVRSSTPRAIIDYSWWRAGFPIPGATGATYTLTAADRGHLVRGVVRVRAAGHHGAFRETQQFAVTLGSAPYATSYPVLSGATKVGAKLSVSKGSWSLPATLRYQWLRNGAVVAGATSSSYTLRAADRGKRMSVRISASVAGYATGVSVTAPSGTVAKGAAAKVKKKPKIKGKKRVGKKLKVSKGTWSLKGIKVSYQWLRNGKKIKKAKKKAYKLTKKDLGKRISVRVTVKKAGHKTTKLVTKKTAKIKAKAKKKR